MNTKLISGIFTIASMFAVSAPAAEQLPDGAKVEFHNPKTKLTIKAVLHKVGEDRNGDGIYVLQDPGDSECCLYGSDHRDASGAEVVFGKADADAQNCKWVLHFSAARWLIMLEKNGAQALSVNAAGQWELQHNQGARHQVWKVAVK